MKPRAELSYIHGRQVLCMHFIALHTQAMQKQILRAIILENQADFDSERLQIQFAGDEHAHKLVIFDKADALAQQQSSGILHELFDFLLERDLVTGTAQHSHLRELQAIA